MAALTEHEVARIILTRPAVEAGERLGFLPGDLQAKVDPYLRPLFDALHDMLDADKLITHIEKGMIEVAPLAFMRGRTLNDSFIILDEAQNTSPEQMQMFLTRLGVRLARRRHRRHHPDRPAARAALGPGQRRCGCCRACPTSRSSSFDDADVVRHKLVQRIVNAYPQHAEATGEEPAGVTLEVEIENRSRWPRRRAGLRRVVARRWRPRASTRRGRRGSGRRAGDGRAERARTAASRRATDVLSFPIDGASRCPRACRASSATW